MPPPRTYGRRIEILPIRLMIVDDSIVARSVFQTILQPHPELQIVATASSADQALAQLDRSVVDVVLLDLAMPGIDGLTALPEIIRRGRGARVLVVSAAAGQGADACIRAMTLGAADTLEKPSAGNFRDRFSVDLIDKVRRIGGEARSADRADAPFSPPVPAQYQPFSMSPKVAGAIDCLAIGASTGGLHALSELFATLPTSCDMPILITQHLPASFMPFFAAQMTEIAGRPASVAVEGVSLLPGQILVAPGDAHIGLRTIGGLPRIHLLREPAASGCMPSVDPMLGAVASHFGERAFAVILSGMGRDGAIAARDFVEAGGEIAVQDRASSVVWGMPGAVAMAGFAATIASPSGIAQRIADRLGGRSTRRTAWK